MRGEPDASQQQSSSGSQRSPYSPTSPRPSKTSIVNGSSNGTVASNGTSAPGSLHVQHRPVEGSFFGHDREQVTRILIQGLQDLGYGQAANALSQESGYDLETNSAAAFRKAVLDGDWIQAESLLPSVDASEHTVTASNGSKIHSRDPSRGHTKLALASDADVQEMLFLLRQQKYLELLEKEDKAAALLVLRQELQPLHQDERQLHMLSSLIMCPPEDLKQQAGWDGAHGESRIVILSHLSRFISPAAMIPQYRLADLFYQVKDSQIKACEYHNRAEWPSLYMDHSCDREELPITPIAELAKHTDEVWMLQFSHDGKHLATAGKDKQVVIWNMETFTATGFLGSSNGNNSHRDVVTYVAWSPNDKLLVTCSQDKEARVWDPASRKCLQTIKHHSEHVTTAAFAPDGKTFVTGSQDQQHPLAIWDATALSDKPLYAFSTISVRVRDCAIAAVLPSRASMEGHLQSIQSQQLSNAQDGGNTQPTRLVIVTSLKLIIIYDYARREEIHRIDMNVTQADITCLNLSSDGQEMLFNLSCNEIWAVSVEDGRVRHKYLGQKQGEFVVRSCYGGATQGFVVSGGEDSHIHIWHRHSNLLLEKFASHAGPDSACCINAVAWNAARPWMWASAGDDGKVRVYGPRHYTQIGAPLSNFGIAGSSSGSALPQWGNESSTARRIFGASRGDDDDSGGGWAGE